jgi:hypothetical protein
MEAIEHTRHWERNHSCTRRAEGAVGRCFADDAISVTTWNTHRALEEGILPALNVVDEEVR